MRRFLSARRRWSVRSCGCCGAGAARRVTVSGSARTSATCSAAGRRACTWGSPGVVALMFLLNRRFADLAIFMVAALVVGGFVMAPNDIAGHGPRHLAHDHGLTARWRAADHPVLPARVRGRPADLPRRPVGAAGAGRRAAARPGVLRRGARARRAAGSSCRGSASCWARCRRRCATWSCRWPSRCWARRRRRTAARRTGSRATGCG